MIVLSGSSVIPIESRFPQVHGGEPFESFTLGLHVLVSPHTRGLFILIPESDGRCKGFKLISLLTYLENYGYTRFGSSGPTTNLSQQGRTARDQKGVSFPCTEHITSKIRLETLTGTTYLNRLHATRFFVRPQVSNRIYGVSTLTSLVNCVLKKLKSLARVHSVSPSSREGQAAHCPSVKKIHQYHVIAI
jgi:hypothetical protein